MSQFKRSLFCEIQKEHKKGSSLSEPEKSFQTLIISGKYTYRVCLFKHNFFGCCSLATDLHSLSLTRLRELKIKITFPEINNQNSVVSAGQLKFLTEMSRVRNQRFIAKLRKKLSTGKAGYNSYNSREPNDANRENWFRKSTTPDIIKF